MDKVTIWDIEIYCWLNDLTITITLRGRHTNIESLLYNRKNKSRGKEVHVSVLHVLSYLVLRTTRKVFYRQRMVSGGFSDLPKITAMVASEFWLQNLCSSLCTPISPLEVETYRILNGMLHRKSGYLPVSETEWCEPAATRIALEFSRPTKKNFFWNNIYNRTKRAEKGFMRGLGETLRSAGRWESAALARQMANMVRWLVNTRGLNKYVCWLSGEERHRYEKTEG